MNLSKISVKRPVTTLMFMFIAILLGTVSLTMLPVDLYPDMDIPVAIVSIDYKGVGPEEIETLITKPVEQSVATVSNLKEVSSYTKEGNSLVVAEFEYNTDMDMAALEMREKVDLIKGILPDGASTPLVLKIDPNSQPIIEMGINGDMEMSKLQTLVEDEIVSHFERIDGVASVDLRGKVEKEIKIIIDQEKLSGFGLTLDDIKNILMAENLNLPGGKIKKGEKELIARTTGEFQSVDNIKDIPILLKSGENIFLSDMAYVTLGYKDKESITRVNNKGSIGISIKKQSTANTVQVAKKVLQTVSNVRDTYTNLTITVGMDQSEFINKSIDNVSKTALAGGSLAVIVLFLFLRNLRSTFVIGISIPVSIISTFALMYFGDLSINLISLGGLALGIGMLVDNSIVVLESIYRKREEGLSRIDSAIVGAKEVAMAVFASTATTIAVFLPIVFVEGFTSILFKQLSFTVTFSLLSSLVISLTIVPMLSSKILKVGEVKKRRHTGISIGHILDLFTKLIDTLLKIYNKILNFALNHRKTIVLSGVTILVVSLFLVGMVGGEFFPKEDEGSLSIEIELPFGTTLEEADKVVTHVENIVDHIPEKDIITSTVAGSPNMTFSSSNKSSVSIKLVDSKDRERETKDVVYDIRKKLSNIPGAKITVTESSSMKGGGPASYPIELRIKGDDINVLRNIGDEVEQIVKSIPGTSDVKLDTEDGEPEVRLVIDRKRAAFYGITASQLATTLKGSIDGLKATTFKSNGEEIDINLYINDTFKSSIENMKQILIKSPKGENVPIGQIAHLEYSNAPTQIKRFNQIRTVTVSSQLKGRDLKSVTKDIEEKLDSYNFPSGYRYDFTGEEEDRSEAFKSLFMALLLSIVLIYMILASQFESLLHPFTVMLSVPFALSGSFIGLFVTNRPLSVPAFIGIIMLAGIVVNNAIVLVDYINQLRDRDMSRKDAIIEAGNTRFRPIIMTTLTTVLGLIPLALGIGEGGQTQAPMATVVVCGLTLSTLLTLVFIPVVYTLFDDLYIKIKRILFRHIQKIN
ncbi:MAG: efflux RND transporter permease subunit [Anaeromicrobium sp.]|jgi:HAE1 family hydrophobic/amphiphilic exporter-1|uniref:efflux RND transporter permease subunit n=1 Tax=Anaeromicrobium sp. TaxID=1929132 RepID=UPI0025F2DEE3|nr:efflux RND transporter permease subunit [Anaeromicrobium sp.]MCT4593009.1 efflux RND transporter permease subunit [Anaeromicrobium sp.]